MCARIMVGAGAWLVGVAAATGGSLLAVSLLGEGIAGPGQQQLTSAAVNRALAGEAREQGPSASSGPASSLSAAHGTGAAGAVGPSPGPPSGGTLLSSAGGTVVAGCAGAGAYLVSWSPQQGYEASNVVRGPAAAARVVFRSGGRALTMVVSCSGGRASGATFARGGGDD